MLTERSCSGNDAGFLEVSVKDLVTNNIATIWKDGGNSVGGGNWVYGQLGFYSPNPHTVTLKATLGGSQGSVAV